MKADNQTKGRNMRAQRQGTRNRIAQRLRKHNDRMHELMTQGMTRDAASAQAYNEITNAITVLVESTRIPSGIVYALREHGGFNTREACAQFIKNHAGNYTHNFWVHTGGHHVAVMLGTERLALITGAAQDWN